jgi:hypothetical protein
MGMLAQWLGPAFLAALVAAGINIVGWFVTFRHTRRLERERRAEKVVDLQTALLAEIRSTLKLLSDTDFAAALDVVRRRLSERDDSGYTPFIPRDPGAPIFSAIAREISILPTEVIDPVVLHYELRGTIAQFADDLRADSFKNLPADRKLAMMEDFFRLKAHSALLARDAVIALERSLGLPQALNNRALVPSVLESASAGSAALAQTSSRSVDTSDRTD